MELKLGKMTNKELAEWFGVKEETFKKKKKDKYLPILERHAKFYEEKGKVYITGIIDPIYVKNGDKLYQDIIEEIPKEWNETKPFNTCSSLAEKFGGELKSAKDYEDSTVYNYTRKGKIELYGKNWGDAGKLGKSIYTFCKVIDGEYVPLTKEENKIKKELQEKYFGDATEKQILINAMILAKEIREEDAFGVLRELTGMSDTAYYLAFLKELEARLGGVKVKKVTMVKPIAAIEDKSAF